MSDDRTSVAQRTDQRGPDGPSTFPLSSLDENILTLDEPLEPWGILVEAELGQRLDIGRLRQACQHVVDRHPLAGARLLPAEPRAKEYFWERSHLLSDATSTVVEVDGVDALDDVREQFLETSVDVTDAPTFEVRVARFADHDVLLLKLSHIAMDGSSGIRVLRSLARSYAGDDDPVPDADPVAARAVRKASRPQGIAARWGRARELLGTLSASLRPRATRVAVEGREVTGGWHSVLVRDDTVESWAASGDGRTVNDVLVTAAHLAVDRWNEAHGRPSGRFDVWMPVNLRPRELRGELLGNYSVPLSTISRPGDRADVHELGQRIRRRTAVIKRDGRAGALLDATLIGAPLRAAGRARVNRQVNRADWWWGTTVVSNLGREADPISFGDAGAVRAVWFAPPVKAPMYLGIGALTYGSALHLGFRAQRGLLTPADLRRFADVYLQALKDVR